MSDWKPQAGDRVLFEEDGNWVTGTVVADNCASLSPNAGWAIKGDLGGIHSGPIVFAGERWVWPITEVLDLLLPHEDTP